MFVVFDSFHSHDVCRAPQQYSSSTAEQQQHFAPSVVRVGAGMTDPHERIVFGLEQQEEPKSALEEEREKHKTRWALLW